MTRYEDVLALGPDYVDDDDLSESVANLTILLLLDARRGAEAAATLARRAPRKTSWEGGLALVGAALVATTKDPDSAIADTIAVRSFDQPLPACWGIARAASDWSASSRIWQREPRHVGPRAGPSVWARVGERNMSGRSESACAVEDTLEPTLRMTLDVQLNKST